MAIIASGAPSGGPGTHADRADLVATWRKRREECVTQLSLGHYEVLNLRRIASIDEVRQAYRELGDSGIQTSTRTEVETCRSVLLAASSGFARPTKSSVMNLRSILMMRHYCSPKQDR